MDGLASLKWDGVQLGLGRSVPYSAGEGLRSVKWPPKPIRCIVVTALTGW